MANINDRNIRNIYFIKEGKILLSNSYKTEGAINGPMSDFEKDLEYINSIIKKASANQKEKLIKEGVSFYLSTNNRDYDNSIIYDLYINEDLVSITYEGEEVSDSLYYAGVKDYKYIYKLLFKCELWYYPYKATCITEEEYKQIDTDYVQKGYWQSRNELFTRRFENKLQEAIEELSKDPTNAHYANIKKATEEKLKNGFVSWTWQNKKK